MWQKKVRLSDLLPWNQQSKAIPWLGLLEIRIAGMDDIIGVLDNVV